MKTLHVWSSAAVLVLSLCLAESGWGSQTPSQQPAAMPPVDPKLLAFLKPVEFASGEGELPKKLKERHNSSVTLLDERIKEYRKGSRDAGSIYQAARLVAEAKLDLTTSTQERIGVLELLLEIHKVMESRLQQQLDKGFGSKADLELARHARLTVEIDLLRAKQKSTP